MHLHRPLWIFRQFSFDKYSPASSANIDLDVLIRSGGFKVPSGNRMESFPVMNSGRISPQIEGIHFNNPNLIIRSVL